MKWQLQINIASGHSSGGQIPICREIDLPFAPSIGLELKHRDFNNYEKKVQRITFNLEEEYFEVYLGLENYGSMAEAENYKKAYEQMGWTVKQ